MVYALIALGYSLVYGILELINFAHGDVFMLGGMISATFITSVFDLQDGASLARYGALVRARVGGWFEGAGPRELDRVIEGLDGPRPAAERLAQALADAEEQLAQLRRALPRPGGAS